MSAGKDVWGDQTAAGPPQPFFHSRWAPAPAHVRELGPDAGLPAGFRAAGVACGIKPSGNPDLGLLVCDAPQPCQRRALRRHGHSGGADPAQPGALHALLAARGSSPTPVAPTPPPAGGDWKTPPRHRARRRCAVGAQPEEVLLGSTGGISDYLPVEKMLRGILDASGRLAREGDVDFQQAIQTTDAFEKRANLEVELPSGVVRLSGAVQGRGHDLAALCHDVLLRARPTPQLAPETAELLLSVCLKRSFDRCTVDGQLSTNDTAAAHLLGRERGRGSPRRARTSCASARRSTRSCASSRS